MSKEIKIPKSAKMLEWDENKNFREKKEDSENARKAEKYRK